MINVCAVICGSRTLKQLSENQVIKVLNDITELCEKEEFDVVEVVSGNAKGADKIGEIWAKENGIDLVIMQANWDKYGKFAGYKRNEKMIHYASNIRYTSPVVIALWDGSSKGTKHTIDIAKRLDVPYYIISYERYAKLDR